MHETKFKRNVDGIAFRCYVQNCDKNQHYVSIRKNSFFEPFTIDLFFVFTLAYRWFTDYSISSTIFDYNVSKCTVIKVYFLLRQRTILHFQKNPFRLGGRGIVCHVDKFIFNSKRKIQNGQICHITVL